MTTILGINAFHADASAALLIDGRIASAVEEERFTRVKHCAGFPEQAILWCLKNSKISISDINHIAINTNPKANFFKKIIYTLRKSPNPGFLIDRFKNKLERTGLKKNITNLFPEEEINAEFHFVEHHLAHLASAYYCSRFNNAFFTFC